MGGPPPTRRLVDGYRARPDASTRRLIVTLFGDTLEPRGGTIWLGTLIELLGGFGVNERLVRTSVQRLVSEGILQNERIGRRSRYSLSPTAKIDARAAESRIYHGAEAEWSGQWTLLVGIDPTSALPPDLAPRLGWRGFGSLRPGVFVSPVVDPDGGRAILHELGVDELLVVLGATADGDDRALARTGFDLAAVDDAYAAFVDTYRPVVSELDETSVADDLAFAARTLLVDDYRRVLLRDPELPAALLPEGWAGAEARGVAARIYRALRSGADAHVSAVSGGELPDPDERFAARFVDGQISC